jgi:aspartate/methionine/tyrosine aminotransferase
MMGEKDFSYSWLSNGTARDDLNKTGNKLRISDRSKELSFSHQLVGNFFHYRTAIGLLGWKYSDVFEQGRLDLNPDKWADFGPLNFQIGPPKDVVSFIKKMTTIKNIFPYPPNIIPPLKKIAGKKIFKIKNQKNFEIICTEGAQSAIAYAVLTFINPNDEVIITDPGYFFFEPPIIMAGGVVKKIVLSEKNDYRIDIKSLKEKITSRTKMIIVCDPVNPFGTIQTKKELEQIINIADKHNIIVLNNITHSFHKLNNKAKHYPMSSIISGKKKNVITIAGLSHGYGLAGLRIGFLGGDPKLVGAVLSVKSAITRININLLMQYAALAALEDKKYFKKCSLLLKNNLSLLKSIIKSIPKLSFLVQPDYGYFCCIDTAKVKASSQELTIALLKRKCAVYPSDGLGSQKATSYIRINFSTPRKKHFIWLERALPEAIKEAETRKYKQAVIDHFKKLKTKRAVEIIRQIKSI